MLNKIEDFGIKISKVLGIIALYFVLQIIFGALFADVLNSSNEFISNASLMLIYALLVLDNLHDFRKENIKIALKNWGLGFFCMFVSNLYLTYFIGNISSNEASNRELLMASPLFSIIMMVVLAPILEEMVFRLNLKKAFKNKYVFCLVSALLFGGMHLISATSLKELLYIIPYGSLGFFFAKAYYETNNIYTSIFAHMFHNGLSVLIILLGMAFL